MARTRVKIASELPEVQTYFQSGGLVDSIVNQGMPAPFDVQVSTNDMEGGYKVAQSLARQLRALSCSEIDSRHYHIAAPTLVIAGEHDAMIPSCYSRRMAERIPDSRFVVVRGAGHNPMVDVPERVLPEVIEFLQASASKAGAPWIGSGGARAVGGHGRFSF